MLTYDGNCKGYKERGDVFHYFNRFYPLGETTRFNEINHPRKCSQWQV